MNAFYVQTSHPIIDYRAMVIEAPSLDDAKDKCEEICGMKPWGAVEVSNVDEDTEKFSDIFFEYVNRDRSNEA